MMDLRDILKMQDRLLDVHVENLGDVLPLEPHFERFMVEPTALAQGTCDPDVGQKVHLQLVRAVSLARLTTPPGHVEAEAARFIRPQLRIGQHGIQVADQVEQFHIGRGIGTGCPANRRLVNVNRLVEIGKPFDVRVQPRLSQALVEIPVEGFPEDVVH